MNETPISQRNPKTHQKHRREVFWQISFPLIIGLLAFLGFAIWSVVTVAGGGSVSQSADTSLVFLIYPAILMGIIPLVLLGGAAYGVIALNKKLPFWGFQAQAAMKRVGAAIQTGANKITDPLVSIQSKMASFDAFKRK